MSTRVKEHLDSMYDALVSCAQQISDGNPNPTLPDGTPLEDSHEFVDAQSRVVAFTAEKPDVTAYFDESGALLASVDGDDAASRTLGLEHSKPLERFYFDEN